MAVLFAAAFSVIVLAAVGVAHVAGGGVMRAEELQQRSPDRHWIVRWTDSPTWMMLCQWAVFTWLLLRWLGLGEASIAGVAIRAASGVVGMSLAAAAMVAVAGRRRLHPYTLLTGVSGLVVAAAPQHLPWDLLTIAVCLLLLQGYEHELWHLLASRWTGNYAGFGRQLASAIYGQTAMMLGSAAPFASQWKAPPLLIEGMVGLGAALLVIITMGLGVVPPPFQPWWLRPLFGRLAAMTLRGPNT